MIVFVVVAAVVIVVGTLLVVETVGEPVVEGEVVTVPLVLVEFGLEVPEDLHPHRAEVTAINPPPRATPSRFKTCLLENLFTLINPIELRSLVFNFWLPISYQLDMLCHGVLLL